MTVFIIVNIVLYLLNMNMFALIALGAYYDAMLTFSWNYCSAKLQFNRGGGMAVDS